MGKRTSADIAEKQHKTAFFAILLASFGILLFIAVALTLPWTK